ncbi:hypothetical protein OCU04_008077 [Sclerotinia nivalis]|uniref:Malonyl-CoA:ACP transacylase (MAT) domain-containing protein n=1 Tax=Sclerotinia nivalis TaxID=352851 RepID=A0A9X0AHB3_9HELO|nr:hypothetical protein OCU04_008077 [Sclerotinia nivalis]
MDLGAVGNAHSPTGLCHTLDIDADGYVKAEAAGDPTEVKGAALAFSGTRSTSSMKSNLGHAEPSAGISGIMKAVMAIEKWNHSGESHLHKPQPKEANFGRLKVKATRTAIPWPESSIRRASVTSFGYGGSNLTLDEDDSEHPHTLVLSANDKASLKTNIKALYNHLINPFVKVNLKDLAYRLWERRTRLWHWAYITTQNTDIDENEFVVGKKNPEALRIRFVFTGQGAQWPQLRKDLLQFFLWTRIISLPEPPTWLLIHDLMEGVKPQNVIGYSSKEIAAAYVTGFLDQAIAIRVAYSRGCVTINRKNEIENEIDILMVGLGTEGVLPYLKKYIDEAWIACFNIPSSLTVSGKRNALESLAEELKTGDHFARLLQIDLVYHSELIGD